MELETMVQAADGTTESKVPADATGAPAKQVSDETPEQKLAKAEQQAQQERANARKARDRLREAEAQLEQSQERTGQLEERLGEIEGKLKDELSKRQFQELATLDPETTDVPQLVSAYQRLTQKVQEQGARIAAQEKFIGSLQVQSQQSQHEQQRQSTVQKILGDCDEEFGAQYRNEATKLADEWVDGGDEPQPTTPYDGYRLMRKAYAEARHRHEAKQTRQTETAVSTDTGLHGAPTSHLDLDDEEFKTGTLEEVTADLRKKMKAGTWKRAFR